MVSSERTYLHRSTCDMRRISMVAVMVESWDSMRALSVGGMEIVLSVSFKEEGLVGGGGGLRWIFLRPRFSDSCLRGLPRLRLTARGDAPAAVGDSDNSDNSFLSLSTQSSFMISMPLAFASDSAFGHFWRWNRIVGPWGGSSDAWNITECLALALMGRVRH